MLSSIPAAISATGAARNIFGACEIAADLAVADVAQVEFNDFVAGEAERFGRGFGHGL